MRELKALAAEDCELSLDMVVPGPMGVRLIPGPPGPGASIDRPEKPPNSSGSW